MLAQSCGTCHHADIVMRKEMCEAGFAARVRVREREVFV